MSNTRVTDKILEKPYFSRVGIIKEIIISEETIQFVYRPRKIKFPGVFEYLSIKIVKMN